MRRSDRSSGRWGGAPSVPLLVGALLLGACMEHRPELPASRRPVADGGGDAGGDPGPRADTARPDTGAPDTAAPLPELENGGFELALEGWTRTAGRCEVVTTHLGRTAPEGAAFLWGGEGVHGTCAAAQVLGLWGSAALVDAQALAVELEVLVASRELEGGFDDQPRLRVVWLDADGRSLGSLETLVGSGPDWHLRGASGLVPPGTREARVEVDARLRRLPDNDAMLDDVRVSFRPVQARDPAITRQPLLQDHRQAAMRLSWETDGNLADHAVRFGPAEGALDRHQEAVRTIAVDDDHYVHIADVEGLEAGTAWQYRVESGGTHGVVQDFRSAPEADAPVRISWMADNQEGADRFARHIGHLSARDPDLLVVAGDLVADMHSLDEWRHSWWAPLEVDDFGSRVPVLVARGNHDRHHPYAYAYTAMPDNEDFYAFRYGPVFVVVLDTQQPMDNQPPGLDQATFLASSLASDAARQADFRVVVFHQAPYSNVRQDSSDGNAGARDAWMDIIVAGGTDLVVAGHYHSYQRGALDGVTHVVVGGGGSQLLVGPAEDLWAHMTLWERAWHYTVMDAEDGRLTWSTYDLEDQLLDRFTLEGGPLP